MDKSHSSQGHGQLPVLELKSVGSGWGPTIIEDGKGVLADFQGLPFQQYNKCDRVGRVVDWLGGDRYKKGDAREFTLGKVSTCCAFHSSGPLPPSR